IEISSIRSGSGIPDASLWSLSTFMSHGHKKQAGMSTFFLAMITGLLAVLAVVVGWAALEIRWERAILAQYTAYAKIQADCMPEMAERQREASEEGEEL